MNGSKKILALCLAILMLLTLAACNGTGPAVSSATAGGIDYMALVNKENPLPDGWEQALETVHITDVAPPAD